MAVPVSKAVLGSRSQRLQPTHQSTMLDNMQRLQRLRPTRQIAILGDRQRLRRLRLLLPRVRNSSNAWLLLGDLLNV